MARCCAIHPPGGQDDGQGPEALAEEELPAAMRALRSSYTDVTKEALATLAANVWVDGQGTAAVRLTDLLRLPARRAGLDPRLRQGGPDVRQRRGTLSAIGNTSLNFTNLQAIIA